MELLVKLLSGSCLTLSRNTFWVSPSSCCMNAAERLVMSLGSENSKRRAEQATDKEQKPAGDRVVGRDAL
jgi:hypothetical protein